MLHVLGVLFCGTVVALAEGPAADPSSASEEIQEAVDVAPVWAGHPVGFALLTHGERQFVAYYDADRRMTVAERKLGERARRKAVLPETVGWDSHNYVTMAVDADGAIHLSGNLHVAPLVYFRTTRPLDVDSFERVSRMVGDREDRTTYPRFFRGPDDRLIFTYRDGKSGAGSQIYNVYDRETRTWSRLLDKPLLDGEGERNAYVHGPVKGPDGRYHICWVWRETPDCATNHDLSYARSSDLVHWEDSSGETLELPITLATGEVVDPVPVGGGIINGNTKIGFDTEARPILSYHKYDREGNTQVYNARLEEGKWRIYQTSDWDWRWEFGGGGAIPFEIGLSEVRASGEGQLVQDYNHAKYGNGCWLLDEETLKPVGECSQSSPYPDSLLKPESAFPGMSVKWAGDLGESGEPGVRYVLRWETLGPNRDRPREGKLPSPSKLRVYKLKKQD